jgi:hypothetical protein
MRKGKTGVRNAKLSASLRGNQNAKGKGPKKLGARITKSRAQYGAMKGAAVGGTLFGSAGTIVGGGIGYLGGKAAAKKHGAMQSINKRRYNSVKGAAIGAAFLGPIGTIGGAGIGASVRTRPKRPRRIKGRK